MVNYINLDGSIRTEMGSGATGRKRKEGLVPAVIYGFESPNDNVYLYISKKEFEKEYLKGAIQTKPIELSLDGKKYKVLVHDIDLDPVTDMPRHVDFMNIEGKKEVKVQVPVNYIGKDKSPGIKRGGFLNILKRRIQVYVDPMNIPSFIEVDVSKAHIGDKIKISSITLPDGIRAVDKSNFNVFTITGRGKSKIDDETPAAAAPAAATVAAPATATPAAKTKK